MKPLRSALPVLLLALWACPSKELPSGYRGLEVPEVRLASAEARQRGRALYLGNCALCHGPRADGHGVRRNLSSRPVSFADSTWRQRTSPREVFHVIQEGVQGTAMPAWKHLDAEQTWDLVAYLLSVAEDGP